MSGVPQLPSSLPGHDLLPYVSAKRRSQIVDTIFEGLGGVERMQDWADKNYSEFMAIWAKGLPKNSATEHTVNLDSVENLLDKLTREENADIVDGTFTEVGGENDER